MKPKSAPRIFVRLWPVLLLMAAACGVAKQASIHAAPPVVAAPVLAAAGPVKPARPTAPAEGGALALRAAVSHSGYSQSEPAALLLKVDYACTAVPPAQRPWLNIALVLDRSGSMAQDTKFPFAMDAAREVVVNLSERDLISLVAFNEQVLVLSPTGRAVNKPFLFHRLDDIGPQGYADLSAGILEGIAQVNSQAAEGQLKQVLVLTDGQANRGVTEPTSLRKIVEKARAKGISVSILGCGTNSNEMLLTEMARAGGGRYINVRSPEQIPNAFKEELRGSLEVVAQNVRLELSVEQGNITRVFGQLRDDPASTHQINIGNLRAGDRGVVLLALKPSDYKAGAAMRATAKLTFDDPQAGERVVRVAAAQSAFAPDGGPKAGENEGVILYGGVLGAMETATEGAEGFDRPRYRQALAGFAQWHSRARQFALNTRNQDLLNHTFLLKHLLVEMEAAEKQGKMHEHPEAREKLKKETDYRRYLLFHHREGEKH